MDKQDSDGLPASEVGAWTEEKHERLRKYIDASHGARRHFNNCTYIDLYCGPGRSWIRETGAFIDGSPLVAHNSAAKHGDQFSEVLISDARRITWKLPEYGYEAEGRVYVPLLAKLTLLLMKLSLRSIDAACTLRSSIHTILDRCRFP